MSDAAIAEGTMSNGDDEPDRVWRDHVAPGVYVEAYDDGSIGVDREALASRIEHKVDQKVSQWTFGCVAQLLAGLALMFMVVGLGVFFWLNQDSVQTIRDFQPGGGIGKPAPVRWDGTSTLVCSGNESMTVSGVSASLAGQTVVHASSNCEITLVDCDLSGAVGLNVSGNASVTMTGGSLTGSPQAVDASGNASVVLQGVKTSGARKSSANAEIQERGR